MAACSSPNYCEENPVVSRKTNVEATAWLAEFCAELKTRLVYTSSEQVFDGLADQYSEDDLAEPRNEYGKQKLESEKWVLAACPEAAVARISVLFGLAYPLGGNFLQQWYNAWQDGQPVTAFEDEIRSFLYVNSAVDALYLLLDQGAEGIFHVAGSRAMSRYDFAVLSSSRLAFPTAKIERRRQSDLKMTAYRPPILNLLTKKIEGIGFQPADPGLSVR